MGRILMVVRPSKGGAFGHVARLSAALAERGHEVAICGPHGAHRDRLPVEILELDIGRSIAPATDMRAVVRLRRIIGDFRPDLIHAHGSKGGVVARLARATKVSTPLAFTPHNYAFTNWFASPVERGAYRAIETALAPLATRVICVCEAERRVAAKIGPDSRTRVVYNGIDPIDPLGSDPALEELAARGPLLAAITEFHAPKGVRTLIEAMPAILAGEPRAQLALAGEGPMRAELEEQVQRLGVGDAVHFLGQLRGVGPLMAAAEVIVSPGWSESFPYSILEAMGAQRPIVATDVGGVGEAITDGVTGRLIPARDPAALAQACTDLLAHRERAAALAAAARERVLERFSFAGMIDGTLGVYAEIAPV